MELIHFTSKGNCLRLGRIFLGENWPLIMFQFAFTDRELQDFRSFQEWRQRNKEK